jgi:Uma2 family endonuclease
LIGGKIVGIALTGDLPNAVAFEIAIRLRMYAKQAGAGIARTDNLGYALPRPLKSGRASFSPDASYYVGPRPRNQMQFIEGAPTLAVEVRSEGDYTAAAERQMAAKRVDYFEAGTKVVWDVDPIARTIRSYTADSPDQPESFDPGQVAHAEPFLPGFQVDVAEYFAAVADGE